MEKFQQFCNFLPSFRHFCFADCSRCFFSFFLLPLRNNDIDIVNNNNDNDDKINWQNESRRKNKMESRRHWCCQNEEKITKTEAALSLPLLQSSL